MALKIAINGFGRIGRCVARIAAVRDDVEIVAINDMASMDMMLYLLKNDSVHGTFSSDIEQIDDENISIDGHSIRIFSDRNPKNLKFADYGADMVLECTGVFLTQESAQVHIDNGVEKVLFSAPAKDKETSTFVMGVNEDTYAGQKIVSNASCTTNCLGPVAKVLDDAFGIEKGLMTTIHSYTNDQRIQDCPHSALRRERNGATNWITTSTGAAKEIGIVITALNGKMNGMAVRTPTPTGSLVDLVVELKKEATVQEVNEAIKKAAEGSMKGVLTYTEDPIVLADIVMDPASSIFDAGCTMKVGNMIKIVAWYDNEWGYSNRVCDLIGLMGAM